MLGALAEKELVKIRNSENKMRYAYVLTPASVSARVELVAGCLKRKMNEYDVLRVESLQVR